MKWTVRELLYGNALIEDEDGRRVCIAYGNKSGKPHPKDLIISAPDLLEACEAAYNFITNAETTQERRQRVAGQLYNALAKAERNPVETKKPTTIGDLIGKDFFNEKAEVK